MASLLLAEKTDVEERADLSLSSEDDVITGG